VGIITKMVGLGSRNLTVKLPVVEDENGRLFVSEIFLPNTEQKNKEADEYDEFIMGDSRQKGTKNNTVVSRSIGGIQHFKGNDNKRFNDGIGQNI